MLRILPLILVICVQHNLYAQPTHFTTSNHWMHQKKELIFGVGASNFFGDLGGLNRQGTHWLPVDM